LPGTVVEFREVRIRIIDAFTDRPFGGNPAAVCLLEGDAWPDESWMQQVASEMNLPMTAFARPLTGDADADWGLRWFTALSEQDICGHATLAAAHALELDWIGGPGTVRFSTRSGLLIAHTDGDGTITLDFPAATVTDADVPDGLAGALGAEPEAVSRTGSLGDLLAVFGDERVVCDLTPDFAALAELTRRETIRGVVATAVSSNGEASYDFVSRFFSPADGLPEDHVTGSAHTALAPYWSARLGRDELNGFQASARGGLVGTALRGDRVHLRGRAVMVLDGTLDAT
jgi:PhzF family phenazine biosynthesis protein